MACRPFRSGHSRQPSPPRLPSLAATLYSGIPLPPPPYRLFLGHAGQPLSPRQSEWEGFRGTSPNIAYQSNGVGDTFKLAVCSCIILFFIVQSEWEGFRGTSPKMPRLHHKKRVCGVVTGGVKLDSGYQTPPHPPPPVALPAPLGVILESDP